MRDGDEGTEPLEFGRFEAHALRLQPLGEWDGVREQDLGAVLWSWTIEMVARDDPAGARHVFHDDGRVAGNVAGEMLADDTAVEVVAAARLRPHQDRNGLARVEFGDTLRGGGPGADRDLRQSDRCEDDHAPQVQHTVLP